MKPKTVMILVVVAFLVILVLQNSAPVALNFLFWKLSMSGIILFPLIFLAGLSVGWLGGFLIRGRGHGNP